MITQPDQPILSPPQPGAKNQELPRPLKEIFSPHPGSPNQRQGEIQNDRQGLARPEISTSQMIECRLALLLYPRPRPRPMMKKWKMMR